MFTPECEFTDDTVMTVAVAAALLECSGDYRDLSAVTVRKMQQIGRHYPACGFGGMFSVEEPAVSTRMGKDKLRRHMATGAEYITGPDSSCLMHLQGIARKNGEPIKFIHVAQILAAGL